MWIKIDVDWVDQNQLRLDDKNNMLTTIENMQCQLPMDRKSVRKIETEKKKKIKNCDVKPETVRQRRCRIFNEIRDEVINEWKLAEEKKRKAREKIQCECLSWVRRGYISEHLKKPCHEKRMKERQIKSEDNKC